MAKRERKERISSDGYTTSLVADGQPRGMAGPSDMEMDGNVLGNFPGFNRATGRPKAGRADWGLAQLNGKRTQS